MTEASGLECVECGASFAFTGEEQERYAARGFSAPKRCPACRARRRAASGGGGAGGGAPPRRGGSGPPRERSPRPRRPLTTVTCAECGAEAEVPFTPAPGRPVFCRDCYRNQRGP